MASKNIAQRSNRILNFFLAALLVIIIRVWYLSVVHYDNYFEESQKPKRRTVIEKPQRATIVDRFNIPLAVNQIQYNAAIRYADIRSIPSIRWEKAKWKKRKRIFERREYIEKLSLFLGEMLDMDPSDIEDTIHGRACLFPHTPFVLKEDISEELFLKLKMSEKDWAGIDTLAQTKRIYPQGKTACDVIGYVGSISQREYHAIAGEMKRLKIYLEKHLSGEPILLPEGFTSPKAVEERYLLLQEKAYSINDVVGKMGVESTFDQHLRGTTGKSLYEVDIRGNLLTQLPGSTPPVSGQRLTLSISSELQQEAEKLLTEYELLQDKRDQAGTRVRCHPWQRGGAIVCLHPKTGEVLALASYPRFDPNDLVPAKSREKRQENRSSIIKWFESLSYIGEIWDGKRPLERERFENDHYVTEKKALTWEAYLDTILSKKSSIYKAFQNIQTLDDAIDLDQNLIETISHQRDQRLFSDLLEMVAPKILFPPSLLQEVGEQSLSQHRSFCQTAAYHLDPIKELAREQFHKRDFHAWREAHFAEFLKQKRKEEKAKGIYSHPYTDYLEKQEKELFTSFWLAHREAFLLSFVMSSKASPYSNEITTLRSQTQDQRLDELKELLEAMIPENRLAYIKTLRTFEDLNLPLSGKYPALRQEGGVHLEKHLAAAFYPYSGFGYGRSQAFRKASPQGSIFKLLPAYAALKQQYDKGAHSLNPLTIVDDMQWTPRAGSNNQVLGYFANGKPIKRLYKGGRLPRAYPKIGEIDVVGALERTSNIYFSLLASDVLESPSQLLNTAIDFGLGSATGIDLPGEYAGILPDDISHNKTGLYAFAIGQHSLVVTPLQTSVMISAIVNGGKILKPQILKSSEKVDPDKEESISFSEPVIKDDLQIPEEIQTLLLKGMKKVTNGERGTARPSLIRTAFHNKDAVKNYRKLHSQMIGKTGTAEILYKQTIDAESKAILEKHTWFGSASYLENEPELVVIVYNRFGTAGKQGAPITAQLISRWREIQKNHYNQKL